MPLPLAHSAAGIASYLAFAGSKVSWQDAKRDLSTCLALVFLAVALDLDFLPGILMGQPNRFHHGPTHALLPNVIFGMAVGALLRRFRSSRTPKTVYFYCVLAAISHPLLDALARDTSSPFGVPLLWPFSSAYFISPVLLFSDVARSSGGGMNFFASMITAHNGRTLLIEIALCSCLGFAYYALARTATPSRRLAAMIAAVLLAVVYYAVLQAPQ